MFDVDVEEQLARALRRTPRCRAGIKAAIMDRVRADAARNGHARALPGLRMTRHSIVGVALAASIGSITTLSALANLRLPEGATSPVASSVVGDSVADRLRDTMRLVRLIFDDPAARQVSVVGDFNRWNQSATPMRRDASTGKWAVTVALHDGEHRYAVVVDETRWVGAPAHRTGTLPAFALLHVSRSAD